MLNDHFDTKKLIDDIKGHVTIELFNAKTGKLEQKTESDNFIAQAGVRHLQWAQRNFYFKDQIYTLNNTLDQDYIPIDPYNSIVLSDSATPEAPSTEWYMPGKLIGYSTKLTYVGSNNLRGSPNGVQSEATPTYTKWVFDWPTNAANGTISSIGWMSNVALTPSGTTALFASSASIIDTKTSGIPFIANIAKGANGVWFGAGGSSSNATTIYVLDSNFQQTSAFNISSQFSTSYTVNGIAWDSANSKLWVLGRNAATSFRIASYNSGGTLIDGPFAVTTRTVYYGLTYDGNDLYTLGVSTSSTTAGANNAPLYKISTSGVDVANYSVQLGDFTGYSGDAHYERAYSLAYDNSRNQIIIGTGYAYTVGNTRAALVLNSNGYTGRFVYYDTSGNTAGVDASSVVWPMSINSFPNNGARKPIYSMYDNWQYLWTPDFEIDSNGEILITQGLVNNTTNSYVSRVRLDGLGSRTVLASPVTKNNTQTMKITYQMNYS